MATPRPQPRPSTPARPAPRAPVPRPQARQPATARPAPPPTLSSAQVLGFDDKTVRSGFEDRPEGYAPKKGRVDHIRIITMPMRYFRALIENPKTNKNFYVPSGAPLDLILEAAANNNWDAVREADPLFDRGYLPCDLDSLMSGHSRFIVLIWHIESVEPGRSTPKKVDQILPWTFPPKTYTDLRNINDTLGADSDGSPLDIRTQTLRIICEDDTYKRIQILPINHPSTWDTVVDRVAAEPGLFYDDEAAANLDPARCSLIVESIRPKPRERVARDLDEIEAFRGGGETLDTGEPVYVQSVAQAARPRSAQPPRSSDAAGPLPADDIDAILGATASESEVPSDSDGSGFPWDGESDPEAADPPDEVPDIEPEAPPPARRPVSPPAPARAATRSPGRPTASPSKPPAIRPRRA